MFTIRPINESFVYLDTEPGMLREIQESFSFRVPGYQFMPAYKMGRFDGFIRLINIRNATAPKGLVPDILNWAIDREYKITVDTSIVSRFKENVGFNWDSLNLPFEPRDYQKEAVERCFRKKRQIILSSTGSGKSLIIYSMIRGLQNAIEENQKILLIVPNISLVNQMYSDFQNYAKNDSWDANDYCHTIFGGKDKDSHKQVFVSTWQSIFKLPQEYFEQFGAVIGDEVHTFKATACSSILEKCVNAFFRFGLTGTLDDAKTHEMQLRALFGPVYRVSSTKDLMDKNMLADLTVKGLILKYSEEECNNIKDAVYQDEINYIVTNEKRNRFICNLTKTRKGNTLVLFQYVDKHGKPLLDMLKEVCDNKQVYMVYGGTDADQREKVRQIAESHNDIVILASYGVYSTGVNIVNLHNIIFASPTKSKIRVLQSVGRGLRKGEGKDSVTLYDIADDLRGSRKKQNFTLKHFVERYNTYMNEGFNVEMKEIML